jgi:hypothetical protein
MANTQSTKETTAMNFKILRVDIEDRKIGLSLKRAQWGSTVDEEAGQRRSQTGVRPARGDNFKK